MLLNTVNKLLQEKGMTLADLAARVGDNQSNIKKRLESGNPTLGSLTAIASALDVPVRYLFPEEPIASPAGMMTMNKQKYAIVPQYFLKGVPYYSFDQLEIELYNLVEKCARFDDSGAMCGVVYNCSFAFFYDSISKQYTWVLHLPEKGDLVNSISRYEDDGESKEEIDSGGLVTAVVREMHDAIFPSSVIR